MTSTIAAVLIAAAVPSDKLSSVALAAYWYKKDERGRGDEISEQAKPRRFPAFAISEDTFLVRDPMVRARHLDRIEIVFGEDRVPAAESERIASPEAVVLKAERPVKGIAPLEFRAGEPAEKEVWSWMGDTLVVKSSGVGTNEGVCVSASTGRAFRQGASNALYVDKERNPVWLDFGERDEVVDGKFAYVLPSEWKRIPADAFEKSAAAIERKVADATFPILIRLDSEDKDNRRSYRRYSDDAAKNEVDAIGYAIGGRVIVPCKLGGEEISRLAKAEATFADGSRTNLVFAGALAEWNAVIFDVPDAFKGKVKPLEIAPGAAEDFDNGVAWLVSVEDENGSPVATAVRSRFDGVDLVRGAGLVPSVSTVKVDDDDGFRRPSSSSTTTGFVLDAEGRIAVFSLARRFTSSRWSDADPENITTADLARFLAGEGVNPEFAPRREEDRNRLVWLGVESIELTSALAREKKAQSFVKKYSEPPYVTEVYPGSPADKAGIKPGDILVAIRIGSEAERELEQGSDYSRSLWPSVENSINMLFTKFGVGAKVTLVYARDGQRHETLVALEAAPVHFENAPKARNRSLGIVVRDMTFEVRKFFKFDDKEPGVVISKVKPGSPANVAGLSTCELVTEVNGEKVFGAKDFAAKVKGKKDLVFAVRHLAQTRMVKMHVEPDADAKKDKGDKAK